MGQDTFIKEEIWTSRPYHTRRLLRECWRNSETEPFYRVIEFPKFDLRCTLAVNNKTLVFGADAYETLVLDPSSGDRLGTLEMNIFNKVVDQLDVSDQFIVTVAISGFVNVWDQNTLISD